MGSCVNKREDNGARGDANYTCAAAAIPGQRRRATLACEEQHVRYPPRSKVSAHAFRSAVAARRQHISAEGRQKKRVLACEKKDRRHATLCVHDIHLRSRQQISVLCLAALRYERIPHFACTVHRSYTLVMLSSTATNTGTANLAGTHEACVCARVSKEHLSLIHEQALCLNRRISAQLAVRAAPVARRRTAATTCDAG